MQTQNQNKLFAFKVAAKNKAAKPAQWKLRDGIASAASCTGPLLSYRISGGRDGKVFC